MYFTITITLQLTAGCIEIIYSTGSVSACWWYIFTSHMFYYSWGLSWQASANMFVLTQKEATMPRLFLNRFIIYIYWKMEVWGQRQLTVQLKRMKVTTNLRELLMQWLDLLKTPSFTTLFGFELNVRSKVKQQEEVILPLIPDIRNHSHTDMRQKQWRALHF